MPESVTWTVAGGRVLGPAPFFVVGIGNCTPDSFYDGGRYLQQDQAVAHGLELLQQGADMVDVGGESTRPFSQRISAQEEKGRVCPVIERIKEAAPEAMLSVDTYRAEVARQALQAGAVVVNDVSACSLDPELKDVLTEYQPGYVLMHAQGRPEDMQKDPSYTDVVDEVFSFLEEGLNALVRAGLPEECVVLDPGIGFGKLLVHNLTLLANIQSFTRLGRPLYMGLSNKSMWSKLLDVPAQKRQNATQVGTALSAEQGVPIHRVHEVRDTVHTLRIVQALRDHRHFQVKTEYLET